MLERRLKFDFASCTSAGITGKRLAYVVTRLDFTPPSEEETGKIFVELKANAKAPMATATLRISGPDIGGRTVAEIFAAKGFVKEMPELLNSYDETLERYFDWRAPYGKQFSACGVGFFAENPTATHRDIDHSRKDVVRAFDAARRECSCLCVGYPENEKRSAFSG